MDAQKNQKKRPALGIEPRSPGLTNSAPRPSAQVPVCIQLPRIIGVFLEEGTARGRGKRIGLSELALGLICTLHQVPSITRLIESDSPIAEDIAPLMNTSEPLPEGVSSANGTLLVGAAGKRHAGRYTCRASDGNTTITAEIHLDVVVSPKVIEPSPGSEVHVAETQAVMLNCRAVGDPPPTTHWDRNLTILHQQQDDVDVEGGVNASIARVILLHNGSLWLRAARRTDADRYGCTAGSAAGLARTELTLTVHPEGTVTENAGEAGGGAARAVLVAAGVAAAYMLLVLALMLYCRRRRRSRRQRGEKMELEMAEGREKLVEEGDEKRRPNGAPNGRAHTERDSGADTSEVSGVSRASRRGLEQLAAPRDLLTEQITLGRGEFGEVSLARIDVSALKRLRNPTVAAAAPRSRPVLVKALSTKDEGLCCEFRRQLEFFGRVRHEGVARLLALCSDADPHLMVLEHTDWDIKVQYNVLSATPTLVQRERHVRCGAPGWPALLPPEGPFMLPLTHCLQL
ncbi:hypothetical protein MSG28_015618 [Choristoneura fumiferana]|uniref:Uncharacterized protein n=1 Tax=Choristoneura fumiferana TaxID=7141 RepID=A0ACC0KAP6_CHOFU|nr:hypothetical protein MSG28_015618 [Choristoneura fumiferana]